MRTPVQQTGRPEPSGPTVQHEHSIRQSSPKTISTRPWRPSARSNDSNTLRISNSCNDMNMPAGIDTNRSSVYHNNTFAISVPLKGLLFAENHLYQQFMRLMAGHRFFYPVDRQPMQPDKEHRRIAKHLLDRQVELHLYHYHLNLLKRIQYDCFNDRTKRRFGDDRDAIKKGTATSCPTEARQGPERTRKRYPILGYRPLRDSLMKICRFRLERLKFSTYLIFLNANSPAQSCQAKNLTGIKLPCRTTKHRKQ